MKKVEPFKTISEALEALDNGGRFYNLLTNEDDEVISLAEVGKVAGVFIDRQKSVLYLDLSLSDLGQKETDVMAAKMNDSLLSAREKYASKKYSPSEALNEAKISSNVIITGIPKLTDTKSELAGFVIVPVLVGKVTVIIPVPIVDLYDIYEIKDVLSSDAFLIAHSKSEKEKLPEKEIRVAGVIKELRTKKGDLDPSKKFLEVVYYSENR